MIVARISAPFSNKKLKRGMGPGYDTIEGHHSRKMEQMERQKRKRENSSRSQSPYLYPTDRYPTNPEPVLSELTGVQQKTN